MNHKIINEQEEYELRGYYSPSFFYMYINGEFNIDYSKMSSIDFGTFVHEYIHYIQNIATVVGLTSSQNYFLVMRSYKEYFQTLETKSLPLIDVPILPTIKSNLNKFQTYKGNPNSSSNDFSFDKLEINIISKEVDGKKYTIPLIDLVKNDNIVNQFEFGVSCIKESQAHLIQEMFDKHITPPIIPYKSVELICEKINPKLLDDKLKIVGLCSLALCSPNSGMLFIELVERSVNDNKLTAIDLYKNYYNSHNITFQNKKWTIKDFLSYVVEINYKTMDSYLNSELKHFKRVYDNVIWEIKNERSIVLETLNDSTKSLSEKMGIITEFYGIPTIRSRSNTITFPMGEDSKISDEMIELLGNNILFSRLIGSNNGICTLYPICSSCNENNTDDNCFENQWLREHNCPFLEAWNGWNKSM
ncbi:MAG: hypothetical protein N4A72_02640 [Bacteroidales bacterium]|jgi:hypothetical protein|nr:hypothetical protein [Bacteroidales bacterium]